MIIQEHKYLVILSDLLAVENKRFIVDKLSQQYLDRLDDKNVNPYHHHLSLDTLLDPNSLSIDQKTASIEYCYAQAPQLLAIARALIDQHNPNFVAQYANLV